MIRYAVSFAWIEAAVDKVSATWRARAKKLTTAAIKARKFTGTSIWSEIKDVFIVIQGNKCAFCEKAMPDSAQQNIEYDVEHFRPKGRVRPWPPKNLRERRSIDYTVNKGNANGYHRLAHDLGNYAVACKECNSPLKSDYFPIAGSASRAATLPTLNAREKPLLIYPIGVDADDPEDFMTFVGYAPQPTHHRGRVCIDFFDLDERGDLKLGRATAILLLWEYLEHERAGDAVFGLRVREMQRDAMPHAACSRAFVRTYRRSRGKAARLHRLALDYLGTKEPAISSQFADLGPRNAPVRRRRRK